MKYIYCVRSVFADVHIVLVLVGYIDVDIAVLTILPCNCLGLRKKTDFILLYNYSVGAAQAQEADSSQGSSGCAGRGAGL